MKYFFEKVDFEKKNQQMTKKHAKLPSKQSVEVYGIFPKDLLKPFVTFICLKEQTVKYSCM